MESLRKLIKETLQKVFISELAKTFIDIPPSAGIVINQVSNNLYDINLFDFNEKKCIGNISLVKISERAYAVNTVGAQNGYGPLMYEVAMMFAHDKGICPDRGGNITPEALVVWRKFYDTRGDVKKRPLKKDDSEYKEKFERTEDNYILNCLYYRPRSTWFAKVIARGYDLKKEKRITDNQIFDICANFFKAQYSTR